MTGGRVLVAVGTPDDRATIRRCLEADGVAAEIVADGAEAVASLRAGRFDLLLLEATLPVLDGVAVVDAVRSDPATASLQIVVVGGPEAHRSVLHCIEMGADDVLWTPLAPASLRARVAAGLARAWLRERERECREQVSRLVDAVAGEQDRFRLPWPGDSGRADDPFGLLGRVLSRMDEEVRECEHRLRHRSDDVRTGV